MTPFKVLYGRDMSLPLDSELTFSKYKLEPNAADTETARWQAVRELIAKCQKDHQDILNAEKINAAIRKPIK